jgi:hypothetical protein
MWQVKEPSLLQVAKYRSKFAALSLAMVTTARELKLLVQL